MAALFAVDVCSPMFITDSDSENAAERVIRYSCLIFTRKFDIGIRMLVSTMFIMQVEARFYACVVPADYGEYLWIRQGARCSRHHTCIETCFCETIHAC